MKKVTEYSDYIKLYRNYHNLTKKHISVGILKMKSQTMLLLRDQVH